MSFDNIYHSIATNKSYFSGIAILGIFFSHLIGVDKEHILWSVFYPGFAGVDIFLFLSGYGLCRSWEKNSANAFYLHRVRRIYPLLATFTLLSYAVLYFVQHGRFTFLDVLCNLMALNFWGVGGVRFEWYLSFIIHLYLLFPLFYRLVRRWGEYVVIVAFVFLFTFLFLHREGWFYQCAFSRVPIFLLGIWCYQQNSSATYRKGLVMFGAAFMVMAALFLVGKVQKFELVYMASPFLLMILARMSAKTLASQGTFCRIFDTIGKYSLEIYVANMLILEVMPLYDGCLPIAVVYFALHPLLASMLVVVNRWCQR